MDKTNVRTQLDKQKKKKDDEANFQIALKGAKKGEILAKGGDRTEEILGKFRDLNLLLPDGRGQNLKRKRHS
jgi:hypothetical protein